MSSKCLGEGELGDLHKVCLCSVLSDYKRQLPLLFALHTVMGATLFSNGQEKIRGWRMSLKLYQYTSEQHWSLAQLSNYKRYPGVKVLKEGTCNDLVPSDPVFPKKTVNQATEPQYLSHNSADLELVFLPLTPCKALSLLHLFSFLDICTVSFHWGQDGYPS